MTDREKIEKLTVGETLKGLWKCCRRDRVETAAYNNLKFYAISTAIEAIQVAAMAEKAIISNKQRELYYKNKKATK